MFPIIVYITRFSLETGKKNIPMVNRDISRSIDTLVNYGLLASDDALF